jgi:hypothetical protein
LLLFTQVRGIGILGSPYTRSCISAALSYPNADLNKGDVSGGTGALIPRCMDIRRRASQTSTSLRSPLGRPSAGDALYRYTQSTPRTPLSPGPMPQSQAALTFADNGGRHPRVPHAPPGSYHSPCRLFSRPMAARTPGVSLKDTAMDINNV